MKLGKLSNDKLDSLILSKFGHMRKEVVCSPHVGVDCAAVDLGGRIAVLSTDPITAADKNIGSLTVHVSCNDAAAAVAGECGGERAFVDKMNAKARELGLTDTRFENPSGLPSDGHYTTARELAKITAAALRDPVFRDIVSTKTCTAAGRTLVNHNRLLSLYEDAIGVKTGFTRAAGRCLVSAAERNGRTVIAVTLNDPDDWNDHIALLDDAFSRYSEVTLHEKGDTLAQTQVFGGETDRAELVAESTVTAYLLPGEQDRLRRVRYGEKFCYAPVVCAAAAGTVEYRLGDAVIASDRLKYGGEVLLAQEKRGLLDRLRQRLAG